jgi:hypothetical protein
MACNSCGGKLNEKLGKCNSCIILSLIVSLLIWIVYIYSEILISQNLFKFISPFCLAFGIFFSSLFIAYIDNKIKKIE